MFNVKCQMSNVVIAVMLLPAFVCGCGKQSEPSETPANGEMRIVSMAPNLTEILFALGLDEEIVGVTRHCNYPEQAQQKRRIGTFWQPDIEAVVAIRPTLVIAEGFKQQRQLAEQLNAVGCKTLTADIETIEQLYAAIHTIGEAVNRVEQAQSLVAQMIETQERLRARYADRPRCKILWVIQREPLRVAGTKTFVNELIEIVGGVNVVGPTLNVYPPISAEQVFAARPDVIIEPTDTPERWDEQAASAIHFYAAFKSIPAVQNSRIYVLDGDVVSRLGPRLNQGLEQIADCLWQE